MFVLIALFSLNYLQLVPTALQMALQFSYPSPVLEVVLFSSHNPMRSQARDWKFLGALLINTDQKYNLPVWSFFFPLEQFLKATHSSAVYLLSKRVFFLLSISFLLISLLPSLYFSSVSFIFFWFALFMFEK